MIFCTSSCSPIKTCLACSTGLHLILQSWILLIMTENDAGLPAVRVQEGVEVCKINMGPSYWSLWVDWAVWAMLCGQKMNGCTRRLIGNLPLWSCRLKQWGANWISNDTPGLFLNSYLIWYCRAIVFIISQRIQESPLHSAWSPAYWTWYLVNTFINFGRKRAPPDWI